MDIIIVIFILWIIFSIIGGGGEAGADSENDGKDKKIGFFYALTHTCGQCENQCDPNKCPYYYDEQRKTEDFSQACRSFKNS